MKHLLTCTVLLAALMVSGCDSTDAVEDDEIQKLEMLPESIELEVGETADFEVVLVTESGDTVRNGLLDVDWWSTDTTVFTVTDGGLANAVGTGTAYCMAEGTLPGKRAARFVGRDSAFVGVQLF